MNSRQHKIFLRIISAATLLVILQFVNLSGIDKLFAYIIPYLIVGYDVLHKAFHGILNRQIFDENFLMTVATLGALFLAVGYTGDYLEAIAVMLFYQTGELFQSYAVGKSRRDISALIDIRPDYANIERDGALERADPSEVETGSVIIVRPGEKIPIDGIIIDGNSNLDTSALTGESTPKKVSTGHEVKSGCINLEGLLRIRTTCEFDESTASKILDLVENASSRKSHAEKFISRFARLYTPVVCYCALALAVVPPLINWGADFEVWLYRALTFLVISCPCALVISVPLTFFAGIGGASRAGILVKGSNFLETLSEISCVVFDKTGTLTKGVFEVSAIYPEIMSETELLHMAAHVERYSTHPAANALRKAYPDESDNCNVKEVEEISGYGVRAKVNDRIIYVGSTKFMDMAGARWHPCDKTGTIIHVAIDGIYAGHVVISDVVKTHAPEAIQEIKSLGIRKIVMLTGDAESSAREAAGIIGLDEYYSELLPAEKVCMVEDIMSAKNFHGKLAFVGDGINDAPVLSRADIGIAMGGLGSDAAIEAADVVLMDDEPLKISVALRISRKCMKIVRENIYFSLCVKILCLVLGAFGFADMWLAVFADVGVMVIAVLNAIRAMFVKSL